MNEGEMTIVIMHGLIGIAGAFSLLALLWGFTIYVSRLGTDRRTEGIKIMQWSIGFMIATIFLITLLRFLQS